jgi:putative heme-binding domain-containing protein
MRPIKSIDRLTSIAVLVTSIAVLALFVSFDAGAQELSTLTSADVEHGQRIYRARCARCHGLQGLGGEGPALARPYLRYARDDETLVSVVQDGIPGTGMPPGGWLSDLEARQVAAYVRTLGRGALAQSPGGDPARGEQLYRRKGACATCHGDNGTGNEFGPALTTVGARRSAEFIRESIVDPASTLPQGLNGLLAFGFREYLPVTAVEPAGSEVRGHRINETSFAILVRDQSGVLHSFHKTELVELTKQFGQSLMPSYRDLLSDAELNDLVAYLIGLREPIP